MKRTPKLLISCISIPLLSWLVYNFEVQPRIALWKAGFSHQTYRSGFVSLLRKEIISSDRKPSLNGWIQFFPQLERLRLICGRNNFYSLEPITQISNLRELQLSRVQLKSVDEIPAFPLLEKLHLSDSICWPRETPPNVEQLKRLRLRLPKLKVLWIDDDYSQRLQFDPVKNEIVFTDTDAES